MGKAYFDDPINHISGKISKQYRTVYNHKRASKLNFTSVHGDRTTAETATELAIRAKFKVCRLAVQNRAMDLSHLTQDQMAFIAERKSQGSAFKYTTFRGWLFGKAWRNYDSGTNAVVWPASL